MYSTAKMKQVLELLHQGKRSGELIKLGFAPGTVYKVQRDFRNSAHLEQAKEQLERKATLYSTVDTHLVAQVTELTQQLERDRTENKTLNNEVARLKSFEEECHRKESVINSFNSEIVTLKSELANANSRLTFVVNQSQLKDQIVRALGLDNRDLKNYLASRNCGWQKDFSAFKRNSHIRCTSQTSCSIRSA